MKRLIIFSLLIFLFSVSSAQEDLGHFNLKAGVSLHRTSLWKGPIAHVAGRLSLIYIFLNHFEVGAYGAYSKYRSYFDHTPDTPIVTYGMELNYNIFQRLRTEGEPKWALYISGRMGGYYAFFPEEMESVTRKHRVDYGAYLGIEYSLSNYFTPYLEVGYGELSFMELGLNFHF
ncbi:MAG: hypothetical protein R6U78_04640 [Bacteroidales bacterium]